MLYNKLAVIYDENNLLRETFDFDIYYPYLYFYIDEEVKKGNTSLSPYRFARKYSLDSENSIAFFLGISSLNGTGYLELETKFICKECKASNTFEIDSQTEDKLTCSNCFENVTVNEGFLSNVLIAFKLPETAAEEFLLKLL